MSGEKMYAYDYPHPAVTVDSILIDRKAHKVLLIRRKNFPHAGWWAFPGGFVEEGESTESAAERELFEETGISGVKLAQFYTVSTPKRDPRGWNIGVIYIGEVQNLSAIAGDDASEVIWADFSVDGNSLQITTDRKLEYVFDVVIGEGVDVNKSKVLCGEGMAFDHALLLYKVLVDKKYR